jgi:molybdopterin-guanine dinucleotide biosynthesis protein A
MTADIKYHKTQIYFIFSIDAGNSLALSAVNTVIKTGVHARLLVFSVDNPLIKKKDYKSIFSIEIVVTMQ